MQDLSGFRERIDFIDARILELLADRLNVCREVAIFKHRHRLPVMQPERVKEVKRRNSERGSSLGLAPQFVENLYESIIAEACRLEETIVAEPEPRSPKRN